MTSCRTLRVASDILSNSSIQHTPPSLRTRAPLEGRIVFSFGALIISAQDGAYLSRTSCLESGSRVT